MGWEGGWCLENWKAQKPCWNGCACTWDETNKRGTGQAGSLWDLEQVSQRTAAVDDGATAD